MINPSTPSLVFAPMEGVTHAAMRSLVGLWGGFDYCVTEFIRIVDQPLPSRVFIREVPELLSGGKTRTGLPVQVQLLGSNSEVLAHSAGQLLELGAQSIDLNFGCPAQTVNKNDGGASLLKTPDRIFKIIDTIKRTHPQLTVSAKIRLGWEDTSLLLANAQAVESAGASWITVHARTRMQSYRPPVHWDQIGRVKDFLKIPVVANGDIKTIEDIELCQKISGCSHFMVGRGALTNPYFGRQFMDWRLSKASQAPRHSGIATQDTVAWASLLSQFESEGALAEMTPQGLSAHFKQWIQLAGGRAVFPWFDEIKRFGTPAEIKAILNKLN